MKMVSLLRTDFYKVGHPFQYPKDIYRVYSNSTPRKSRLPGVDKMVFFGLQYYIKEYLIKDFNENFFNQPLEEVLRLYKRRIKTSLGKDLPHYDHIINLHKLGYLPIKIKALPEGSIVPMRVPTFTIVNTHPDIIDSYWLTNWCESSIQCSTWQPCVSATIANEYRKLLDKWAKKTGMDPDFVQFQGHDFSYRGHPGQEAAMVSGMGHLLSFVGTDTIPAIEGLEQYYNADCEKELIGTSIPATEHAVMCAGGKESELETFNRIIDLYGDGPYSIVSDTWNLWDVITKLLPQLKNKLMVLDGKLVIRGDSGNPVDIMCGLHNKPGHELFKAGGSDKATHWRLRVNDTGISKPVTEEEVKGVVELLWDLFGGTFTSTGHRLLNKHIGGIYGDSITLNIGDQICERLHLKNFASQCVLGIGSMTYVGGDTTPGAQYWVTRDLFGIAMKATYVEREEDSSECYGCDKCFEEEAIVAEKGESYRGIDICSDGCVRATRNIIGCEIFKDPVTDDGTKKSAKGLLTVIKDLHTREYELVDQCTPGAEEGGCLETVFEDGKLIKDWTLQEVRDNLKKANEEAWVESATILG